MSSKKYKNLPKVLFQNKEQPVSESILDEIYKIIINPTNPEFARREYIDNADIEILCALLDTSQYPMEAKNRVISTLVTKTSKMSQEILVPLIFYGNQENLQQLSSHVSDMISSHIEWKDFSNTFNEYLNQYPNATTLPFNNTYIEKFLFDKLLVFDSSLILRDSLPLKVYEFIEYISDAKILAETVDKRFNLSSRIVSSLINNKHLPREMQTSLFDADFDITTINKCPSNKIKEIYNSLIYPVSTDSDTDKIDTTTQNSSAYCLYRLVRNNQLPESCQLDMVKRYINDELHELSDIIVEVFKNTTSPLVIEQALNVSYIIPVIHALRNPCISDDTSQKMAEQFLYNIKEKKGVWSNWDNVDYQYFIFDCLTTALPDTLYLKLFNVFPVEKTTYRQTALEIMALNAKLPHKELDNLASNPWSTSTILTFRYFNQQIRQLFSIDETQKILDSIHFIYNQTNKDRTIIKGKPPLVFLPDNSKSLIKLEKFLRDTINNNKDNTIKTIANYYYKLVIQKQMDIKSENIIHTGHTDELSKDLLMNTKSIIENKINTAYNEPLKNEDGTNVFANYLLHKNLIEYMDIYQKISDKIEKEIPNKQALER